MLRSPQDVLAQHRLPEATQNETGLPLPGSLHPPSPVWNWEALRLATRRDLRPRSLSPYWPRLTQDWFSPLCVSQGSPCLCCLAAIAAEVGYTRLAPPHLCSEQLRPSQLQCCD